MLIQLTGYLKGRDLLQEFNLLGESEKASYDRAVVALGNWLDMGSKVMTAQDFSSFGTARERECSILSGDLSEHLA